MRWTGTHWTSDDLRSADGLAKRLARRDKDDKNAATSNAISAALNLARSAVGLGICETDLDPDPALLNTATGTVDLRTGELYPHRPQDLISRCTPAGYYPADLDRDDYGAPTWTQLLRTIIPDEQTRTWFQTAMGMAINGQLHEDLLLKIHGPGGNGKSTVFMALRQALGDYVGYANSDMLTARDGAQPHQLADLAGKRLLVIPETDEGARLHVATFKKLAGREPIKACRKYEHEFEYAPTHTAVLMTNHTLSINSTDNGTWRRLRLVPFGVKITSANAIADVDAKLAAEASGVLAWAIAGAKRYADAGYELGWCPEVEAATRQYRDDQDVLGMYVAERLVKGDDHRVKKPLMYADYTQWCLEGGSKPRSNRNFYAAMKTAGYLGDGSVVKSNGNEYVLGYALRAADRGGF